MSKELVPWSTKVARMLAGTKSVTSRSANAAGYDCPASTNSVSGKFDQSSSSVGGHQIGSLNVAYTTNYASSNQGNIENLLLRLQEEMSSNVKAPEIIAKLQRFQRTTKYDGIVGLEAKLKVAGREYEFDNALEMKEMFAKLLERFSLYASAQEILAYLLARAEYNFIQFIYPQIGELKAVEVNEIVHHAIVAPTVEECGSSVFAIDHSVAMGMIYWLAEQCHIRWHA